MAGQRGEYRKTAARRKQILEAAFEIFSTTGYSASSVNEIARSVGMTQTGVLHHFRGGKPALLRAVLELRDQSAIEILQGRTGLDFLAGLLEISAQQMGRRGVVQLYTILSAEASDPGHPANEYFRERFELILRETTAAFAEAGERGQLHDWVDPREAALGLIAVTEGLELLWLHGFDVDLAEGARQHIARYLVVPF